MRHLVWLILVLATSAAAARENPDATIVTLGDSITKGVRPGVTGNETFSAEVARRLSDAGLRTRVVNQGVGGETTAGGLKRLADDVLALKPATVVVMYGTNDCHIDQGKTASRLSIEEYRRNLDELVARIRAAGAEPILMTEPCYAKQSPANGLGEHGNVRLAEYMRACRMLAAQRDVVLVENFERWLGSLESGQSIEDWTTDGYHPNPRGHREIAEALFDPLAAAVRAANSGPVDFNVEVEEVLSHDDREYLWYHPRAVVFPNRFTRVITATAMLTLQRHLMASDHYDGLATMIRGPRVDWSDPTPIPALAWRKNDSGDTVAVCDVTPGFHEPTGKVLAIGAKILYDDAGTQLVNKPRSHEVAYAVYTATHAGSGWSEWRTVELPDTDTQYFLATPGCAQWIVEPDGSILLPVYHRGETGEAYSTTVLKCDFDGERLKLRQRGGTLELRDVRGLCEPSLARYRGRYYLTLRNDLRGYVATSDDGLNYPPIKPWTFDDGAELGSYNTQQHWLAHSEGLFLVYTRRGAGNDHIIRHRAPLFAARVDTERLQVLRATEKIVIPERGGELGNFGANPVSARESWVTVGEGVWDDDARQRGARGTVFVAHLRWTAPNRVRGGSGPGRFVDQLRAPP